MFYICDKMLIFWIGLMGYKIYINKKKMLGREWIGRRGVIVLEFIL